MEPDIVRMYSSSPPPLDNAPDEEEEEEEEEEEAEFGDFGGFSDVGSTSVSFDFASEYSSSKEEHKSSFNSDYSGRVDSVITFTTIRYSNNKDSTAELPTSIKELPDSTKEKCECRNLGTSFEDVIPVEVKRAGKLESSYSEIIRTDLKVPKEDQQIDSCNGERLPFSEVLTNGFSEPDTANSQGVKDLDSVDDPKGLKTISTHSTELNLDSIPSTQENFATFSHKQTAQVEETKNEICKYFSEKQVLNAQENYVNRIGEAESMKEAILDESCECEGETFTEGEHICISKTNLINNVKPEKDCTELESNDTVTSVQTNVNSIGTIENAEEKREDGTGNNKEHAFSSTSDAAKTADLHLSRLERLSSLPSSKKVNVSEIVKNGESDPGHASSNEVSEDDFGDFSIVSNGSLAFADSVQTSASQELFQPPFENLNNECSEFTATSSSLHQQSTEVAPCQPNEISGALLEEHPMVGSDFSKKIKPSVELENGDDNEFGDFDSGSKRFPDSDEFSDFSSAGCNQATEWDAFETEQKESCLWATFEDEQMVESRPREDVWPSHTVDTTYSAEDSVNQAGNEQLEELQVSAQVVLLNRLERIFKTCFPPVLVSEMTEEIPPLNLMLEVGRKPERTVENLSERELLDVWAELQDIHDAYGLRYQWGGSHSNKKLLCSLGIDTRNILFTGNKKQPVIVPMYAAGLGMLEPTKEPMKPISAAEKIASIGQTSSALSPEINICTSDQLQESLPPVQFDWSSSGLTNPLDGVDPELYELTTSKLETSKTTSKVTDAFAKLMSTVEKASTSARKPQKEEQLSDEAAKVISSLPDLSFMHAKVLMFPSTLTPSTVCQGKYC